MNKLLMLIQRLLSDGRSNDIEKVSPDTVYCKKLLMEYGIAWQHKCLNKGREPHFFAALFFFSFAWLYFASL